VQAEDVVRQIEQQQPQPSAVLPRLSAALLAAEPQAEIGDQVVDHFVQEARAHGASWSDIGQCMGVSKQAAQKRYVAPREGSQPSRRDPDTPAMRRVVDLGTEEARALGHAFVGTEHLVLGVLRTRDPATAAALATVDLDDARAMIISTVGRGGGSTDERLPITPRARKVLAMAMEEAAARGHSAPDVAHVLLAVIRERKGVGGQVLDRLAGGLDGLQARVLERLPDTGQSG
jgi:hypothetical protein